MSLNLPSHITLPTSPGRHNTAIAEVVLWGIVWISGISIRTVQEWRWWKHRKARRALRCFLFAWWKNLIVLLAQIRVVGFVLFLVNDGKKNVAKSIVITEVVLQGVGVSPLTLELSLVLIKCGRVGLTDRKQTHYTPRLIKTLLEWTRLPIFIAIILIIVAGFIVNTDLIKAGSVVILFAFVYLLTILAYLFLTGCFAKLPRESQKAILVAAAAVPLYIVRLVYMLLGNFGDVKFSPAIGDWKISVGMEFFTEIGIVICLIGSTLVVEPVWGRPQIATDNGSVEVLHNRGGSKNEAVV